MSDLERMYASLSREADTVTLDTPNTVRHRADRRTRIGVAAATVAVAALVGGVAVGRQWMLAAGGQPVHPGTATSSSPSASSPASGPSTTTSSPAAKPSSSATPATTAGSSAPPTVANVPKVIPASAFLQVADTNGEEPLVERPSDNMLPPLCGVKYASDSLIQARKTMHITYWASPSPPGTVPDGTFDETITTYKRDGAERFMRQLRDAVTACPTQQRDGITYRNRILSVTARGDESVLIERRYPARDVEGNPTGREEVRLVSVVRIGAVVMVLYEQGWEAGWSAEQPVVDAFTGKAFSRLRAWLG
jgi:hypothetical protein